MNRILTILLTTTLLLSAGCAYRVPVQQGNIIQQSKVDQLTFGMDKDQVLFLMGNPLVKDPMHVSRWDYVYFLKPNRGTPQLRRVTLHFNRTNKLERVEQVPDYGTRINRLEDEAARQ